MRLLVFGSRSLTARHLPAMRYHLLVAAVSGPVTPDARLNTNAIHYRLNSDDDTLDWLPSLTLIHGDGPPGKVPGCVGADKMSEIAASLEWPETRKVRPFPPEPFAGETWAAAALRRNAAMVALTPDYALCFHTDPSLGRGSAHTASLLTKAGLRWRLVLMKPSGDVVSVEER